MVACWQVTQSNAPIVCSKFSGQQETGTKIDHLTRTIVLNLLFFTNVIFFLSAILLILFVMLIVQILFGNNNNKNNIKNKYKNNPCYLPFKVREK
jgi:hypothetical protein